MTATWIRDRLTPAAIVAAVVVAGAASTPTSPGHVGVLVLQRDTSSQWERDAICARAALHYRLRAGDTCQVLPATPTTRATGARRKTR